MLEGYVDTVREIAARHVLHLTLSPEELQARTGRSEPKDSEDFTLTRDGIAVLPLHGVISQKMNLMAQISGGTSTEKFGHVFGSLMDDKDVRAILLDVNSPGGSVYGLDELHAQMMESRGRKPVVAHVSPLAASAAYWIASAVDHIAIDPGAEAGSLGVFAIHQERSEQEANEGIKTTVLRSRKFKAEGNPHEPLTDDARTAMQERIDEADARFYAAVAAGRGKPVKTIESGYGQGRLLSAKDALRVGMVDRIATRAQVLSALAASLGTKASASLSASDTAQEAATPTAQDRPSSSASPARIRLEFGWL